MMYPNGYNCSYYDCVVNANNGASYYGSRDGDGGVPYKFYEGDNNYEEVEELSVTRLLTDCAPDINFYICQLQLMRGGG